MSLCRPLTIGGIGRPSVIKRVYPGTLLAEASTRTSELAEPRACGAHFMELRRPVPWIVSERAMNARASERTCQLAEPRSVRRHAASSRERRSLGIGRPSTIWKVP